MALPEITLLVPCYNAGRFLPRLMGSARSGSRPFAEIICYDDGSADDTAAVARQLGAKVMVGPSNVGVTRVRNRLAAAATTEWFHFHDADDAVGPRFVEVLGSHCTRDVDVVTCDADWIDETTGSPVLHWRYDSHSLHDDAARYLVNHPMSLNNSVIRRTAWSAIGGCDERLGMWEDADVHLRLALNGSRYIHVPAVHSYAYRRSASLSHDYRRSWNYRLQALDRYAREFPAVNRTELITAVGQAAAELVRHADLDAARAALTLARRLGEKLPRTSNPLIMLCRTFLGSLKALQLQSWVRQRLAR